MKKSLAESPKSDNEFAKNKVGQSQSQLSMRLNFAQKFVSLDCCWLLTGRIQNYSSFLLLIFK